MKRKIAIVCPYPIGVAPSQRLKYEQYIPNWKENGWDVDSYPFQTKRFWKIVQTSKFVEKIFWTLIGYFNRAMLLFKIGNYDVVYVHLWVTPFGWPIFEYLYRHLAKTIIFDIDDLVYLKNSSEANSWVSNLKGKQKPIYLMKHANHVISTTPYLIDFCKQYNSRVSSIPPSMDENLLYPTHKDVADTITIGWSGSYSTLKYLDIVAEPLKVISRKYKIQLVVFGVNRFELDGVSTTVIPWSAKIENTVFNQMDIAIYPLEKEEWSEGKYGGKLIQYLATGLPIIVSNANALIPEIIENNKTGIITENTTQHWINAFALLIEHHELRKELSVNGRAYFLDKFSISANKSIYLDILNSTAQLASQK